MADQNIKIQNKWNTHDMDKTQQLSFICPPSRETNKYIRNCIAQTVELLDLLTY